MCHLSVSEKVFIYFLKESSCVSKSLLVKYLISVKVFDPRITVRTLPLARGPLTLLSTMLELTSVLLFATMSRPIAEIAAQSW